MAKQKEITDIDITSLLNKINDLTAVFDTDTEPDASGAKKSAPAGSAKSNTSKSAFGDAQLSEIELGRKQHLRTSSYAKECYNWMQMQEIRKGLLMKLDTALYENPLFSSSQMREIRLGLADGLDVSSYARLLYSATDMRNARAELFSREYRENPRRYGRTIELKKGIRLRISDDYLKAFITISSEGYEELDEETLRHLLSEHDINRTIHKKVLEVLLQNKPCDTETCIAEGYSFTTGKAGWFELFFDNPLDKGRLVQPDDEIDYSEIKMVDLVQPEQKLVQYHLARQGRDGLTVHGLTIRHPEVKELPALMGMGFSYNPNTLTYCASTTGYPSYNASTGSLTVCMIYEVHGNLSYYQNMSYDGTVHVHGSLLNHATIHATGDVIIDGYMENGFITSDQNVVIKGGVNGGGIGVITAGGSVKSKFFEYATVQANGSIEGNYFLDCRITTDDRLIVKGRKGRIMGGTICAAVSVEAVTIGNYLSNKTSLTIGDLNDIDSRIVAQERQKKEIADEIEQLNAGLQKLISLLGEEQAPKNALYTKTATALEIKENQSDACDREIARLSLVMKRAQKASVHVHGDIQENVTFTINGVRKRIEKPIKRGMVLNKFVLLKKF